MRVIEVRDGFVKFESEGDIKLSSFIQIDGIEKKYIAQVIQLKKSGTNPIGYAKILFLYNGELQNYDNTLPSEDSSIEEFDINILLNSINYSQPVIIGKTLAADSIIIVDDSVFDKKMFICTDDKNANNLFVRNLTKQFNNLDKKVVIIDTLGVINARKVVAGQDFKLPLDTQSLSFMYKDCLNDATGDSKSLIIEIFKDLSEYSKTVPFLPFSALKKIVDDMVDKSHIFKLLVLKNKLAKFDKLGYFAKDKSEVDSIDKIFDSKCVIIDFSKLDVVFQNRYIEFIYEKLENTEDVQVLFELSNTVSKKCLKDIISSKISTTFITHSKFKYISEIKNLFDNFILTPSFAVNQIFTIFNSFLKSMTNDCYLVAGEGTNYIPLVSPLEKIDDLVEIKKEEDIEEYIQDLKNENIKEDSSLDCISEEDEILADDEVDENKDIQYQEDLESSSESISDLVDSEENQIESVEENAQVLTEAEIISTIEEKSQDVISKVTENVEIPETINMFNDDELVFENDNSDIQQDANSQNIDQEGISEENVKDLGNDANLLDALNDENNELRNDGIEEIPLSESFSTEVHTEAIIEDYVPLDDENELQEEISITDEISPEFEELNPVLDQDEPAEGFEEQNEIVLENDIDLDLDSSDDTDLNQINDSGFEQYDTETAPENEEISVAPINNEENFDGLDEIVELNPDDIDDNDIIIDMTEDEPELPENVDEQIVKDVDKVFTTRKDDDISDSDLDFIDELNGEGSEILEEIPAEDNLLEEIAEADEENSGILESVEPEPLDTSSDLDDSEILETRTSSTPIVPVYDADIPQEDLVESDPIQQGDSVTHAKYGSGVVEKMIKYGNKTLYSINFDNIGRRLLDPTLTEIKKS